MRPAAVSVFATVLTQRVEAKSVVTSTGSEQSVVSGVSIATQHSTKLSPSSAREQP